MGFFKELAEAFAEGWNESMGESKPESKIHYPKVAIEEMLEDVKDPYEARRKYKGQYIRVKGRVQHLSSYLNGFGLIPIGMENSFRFSGHFSLIRCNVDSGEAYRQEIEDGSIVTVRGKITDVVHGLENVYDMDVHTIVNFDKASNKL